ncbi:putative Transcriptional regulator [metagenome]|uniref:Putative Transcriptional regulator n=1 Tax=metagenome TaxID=256318 RepID=A0A2P2BWN6_9ZZZZ
MEISLHRLRILREVAHHGGVTAAAGQTRYSASGISQQMAALEHEVGAPVLERRGRGVALTEVGRVLLEHAEILLEAERNARSAVERARNTLAVELTVGVFATAAAGLMPQITQDLTERHPEIAVRTRELDPDDAGMQLRHGHVDLAFLIDYPDAAEPWSPGIDVVPVLADDLRIATPAGLFRDRSGPVELADLADLDWVISGPDNYYGRAVGEACRRAGFAIRITHQVDEQATALAMVAAGLGVTLMSDLGRVFLPVEGVDVHGLTRPLRRQILVAHQESADTRPAVRAFLESAVRAGSSPRLHGG